MAGSGKHGISLLVSHKSREFMNNCYLPKKDRLFHEAGFKWLTFTLQLVAMPSELVGETIAASIPLTMEIAVCKLR